MEPGAVHDHVDLVLDAVGRHDARRGDTGDRFGDQIDVRSLERAGPHPVVAEQSLGGRRILGDHLVDADRAGPRTRPRGTQSGPCASCRSWRSPTDRRLPTPRRLARRRAPRRPSSRRSGNGSTRCTTARRTVQPPQSGRHLVVVLRRRAHPRRCALEHEQLPGHRRDLGDELHCACARADHGHPLAGQVHVVVPTRRVERVALEGVTTFDVG